MVLRTPSNRLERRRLLDRAWQRYVVDGVAPDELAAGIVESWRRARDAYRIDPALRQPRLVLAPDALAARRGEDDAFALAAPILQDFGGRLGVSGHVLAWFDGEGLMLALGGDERVVEAAGEDDFRPGASWAEASAGTNGPGTALAERRAIEVFASEHFVAAWQKWSCAAVPVFAPGREAPVGIVDITGPWEIRRRQALLVARGIASAVEERLRAAQGVRDEVVRYAFQAAQRSGEALVAVDGRGRLVAANELAARRRVVEGGALPAAAREGLVAALRGAGGEIRVEPPGLPALVATRVEFQGRSVGAIVRVEDPGAARGPRGRGRSGGHGLGGILGRSEPLRRAVELARSAAGSDVPVILHGEPGTGRELFARAIHAASARQGGPFVAVSCRAIPAARVEAELFGYEAGTFGGARRQGSPGKLELAGGGTLFLDEASELPPAAQAALRRALQEGEVVRLGGSAPRSVDVRVVAATREPIEAERAAGRPRRDLLRALDAVSISIPPLRDRGDDVELLALVFLAEAEGALNRRGLVLSAEALAALRRHPWPGNVRELRSVILRAAAIAERSELSCADLLLELPAPVVPTPASTVAPPPAPEEISSPPLVAEKRAAVTGARDRTAVSPGAMLRVAVRQSEREVLLAALDACGWNFARAARRLGVSRMTLYRRLAKCGISRTGGA